MRILDSAGNEIPRTFTTASCGTGCRGDYSVAVSYLVPRTEHGTIEVFESSAKSGPPVNVQLIPVTLTPKPPRSGQAQGSLVPGLLCCTCCQNPLASPAGQGDLLDMAELWFPV